MALQNFNCPSCDSFFTIRETTLYKEYQCRNCSAKLDFRRKENRTRIRNVVPVKSLVKVPRKVAVKVPVKEKVLVPYESKVRVPHEVPVRVRSIGDQWLILHLVLTILTGIWGIVWLIHWSKTKEITKYKIEYETKYETRYQVKEEVRYKIGSEIKYDIVEETRYEVKYQDKVDFVWVARLKPGEQSNGNAYC